MYVIWFVNIDLSIMLFSTVLGTRRMNSLNIAVFVPQTNIFNTLIVSAKPNRMGKKRRMAASSEGEQHNGVKACLGGPAHTCLASAWHVLNAPSMFVELN